MSDDIVARACVFATQAHQGQTDKCERPFIGHPAAVAGLTALDGMSREAVAAAWLHDVVEDTPTTLLDIRRLFGERVAELVDLLTRRDGETYRAFIGRLRDSDDAEAIRIKLNDIQHNSDPQRNACIPDEVEREAMAAMVRTRYAWATDELMGAVTV